MITEGERSKNCVDGHKARIRLQLLPYFGSLGLSQITAGKVHDYRVERIQNPTSGKAPSYSTLHDAIVTLRMVLKSTLRMEWLHNLQWVIPHFQWGPLVALRCHFQFDSGCDAAAVHVGTIAGVKVQSHSVACS